MDIEEALALVLQLAKGRLDRMNPHSWAFAEYQAAIHVVEDHLAKLEG